MYKTNYPELESMVKNLVSINESGVCGKRKRIAQLQKICEVILNKYQLKINDNIVVEPLRVEAYYYHEGKYEDGNTYKSDKQKFRFGKLNLHERDKNQSDGVDLCLSYDDFFLSFLIKNSLIKNKSENTETFIKQQSLHYELEKLDKDIEERENVLIKKPKLQDDDSIVFFTVRKGLVKGWEDEKDIRRKKQRFDFLYEPLAAMKGLNHHDYDFDYESGFGKQWVLAKYALEKANLNIEKARKNIKQEGLYQYKIEDRYIDSALRYIQNQGE